MGLEERVAEVERENRRLKHTGVVALTLLASLFLMGQYRTPQTIEAENFVVRDRRGVELASFGAAYPVGSNTAYASLSYYTYLPDGRRSIGTMFQGGAGEEGFFQLQSASGSITMRTAYGGSGPTISISDNSNVLWVAP